MVVAARLRWVLAQINDGHAGRLNMSWSPAGVSVGIVVESTMGTHESLSLLVAQTLSPLLECIENFIVNDHGHKASSGASKIRLTVRRCPEVRADVHQSGNDDDRNGPPDDNSGGDDRNDGSPRRGDQVDPWMHDADPWSAAAARRQDAGSCSKKARTHCIAPASDGDAAAGTLHVGWHLPPLCNPAVPTAAAGGSALIAANHISHFFIGEDSRHACTQTDATASNTTVVALGGHICSDLPLSHLTSHIETHALLAIARVSWAYAKLQTVAERGDEKDSVTQQSPCSTPSAACDFSPKIKTVSFATDAATGSDGDDGVLGWLSRWRLRFADCIWRIHKQTAEEEFFLWNFFGCVSAPGWAGRFYSGYDPGLDDDDQEPSGSDFATADDYLLARRRHPCSRSRSSSCGPALGRLSGAVLADRLPWDLK